MMLYRIAHFYRPKNSINSILKNFLLSFNFLFYRFLKSIRLFIVTIWAMFASTFAAISTFQVVCFRKNFIALFVIVKVFVFFDYFLVHKLNQNGRN